MSKNEMKKDKYSAIRGVLREYSSKDRPMKMKEIAEKLNAKGYSIKRTAIETALQDMEIVSIENEFDYYDLRKTFMNKQKEVIYCKETNGRKTDYWIENPITDSELGLLVDMVLSSKILTIDESRSLADRLLIMSGKDLEKNLIYRHRVSNQPYMGMDKEITKANNAEVVISEVAQRTYMIRQAISLKKKVKFTLNVYDWENGKIIIRPCQKREYICSPYDVIMSNGRYYMLGAESGSEHCANLKYKLYRVDLMTDLYITKATSLSRKEAGIKDTDDIYRYRIENPYMYTGEIKRVHFKIDRDEFTQVVDWFGDGIRIFDIYLDENCLGVEVKVNTNSFIFWVLQYSGCVEVLSDGTENHFREAVKLKLNEALQKYLKSDYEKKEVLKEE